MADLKASKKQPFRTGMGAPGPAGANDPPPINMHRSAAMGTLPVGGNTKGVPSLPGASTRAGKGTKNAV